MNKRRVSIPRMGDKYTEAFKDLMENLGLNVILPPKTTDKTVQIGVRNTAEMICFPIKPLIGNFAEALDAGADTLFMYDSMGQCRLKHYSKIQELALRDMGYTNFKMYSVGLQNVFQILNKLGGYSYLAILKEFISFYGIIKKIDKEKTKWSKDKPNIGIIGEIFTCCDERTNHGIEEKIRRLGANPINTVTLSKFLKDSIIKKLRLKKPTKHKKQVDKYLNGELGGHGRENLFHLLELIDENIEGIIHILPMSCMPEVTIEPCVNSICRKSKIPLLRIPIDENTAEANLETRLETFIELIKMRRSKQ